MQSTRVSCDINAPRAAVYHTLLDASAVAKWKVPDGMTCHVHAFDAREGGVIRISLTYDVPTGTGKTTPHTDTYHGRFLRLVPDQQIVEVDEFETDDPGLRGEMTITISLSESGGGTRLTAVHDGLPDALSPAENEAGWRMALAKLAALAEARHAVASVPATMAGYSGTPLPRKLGLRSGQRLAFVNPPENLDVLLGALPESAREVDAGEEFDLAILFSLGEDDLRSRFAPITGRLAPRGMLWVAWPKKASRYPTDLSEDVVRAVGLETGLVDVKVCAIDEFWSGLKFVHRVAPRAHT